MSNKAIVLLSGGLDSTTALAVAKSEGRSVHAMTFDYGQRHRFEIDSAYRVAKQYKVDDHILTKIDLRSFGGSALTSDVEVPAYGYADRPTDGIPVTYVPARNTIFLSFALAWSDVIGASEIFLGVNALDYGGYPDCRPEYIDAYQRMANLATRRGARDSRAISIRTPLIDLSKAQIIALGLGLQVDYSNTSTCYSPSEVGVACGRCDACQLRLDGFSQNGVTDPIHYQQAE